jgi:hypothetical protein
MRETPGPYHISSNQTACWSYSIPYVQLLSGELFGIYLTELKHPARATGYSSRADAYPRIRGPGLLKAHV